MRNIVRAVAVAAGILTALYPWASNYLYERQADAEITAYEGTVTDTADVDAMLAAAQEYNAALASSHVSLKDPFDEGQAGTEAGYTQTLDLGGGLMGYVEVPCIGVRLPIYHGTDAATLEKGVGHLEGTSFPVGGAGTHAVLTGHTGLSTKKLFTDLTQVVEGDQFYIHVLGSTYAYEVSDIQTVLPDEIGSLGIVEGEDLVTLVTCTPYGVNDHRLLVTGTRTEYNPDAADAAEVVTGGSQWMGEYARALAIGLAALAILGFIHVVRGRKR